MDKYDNLFFLAMFLHSDGFIFMTTLFNNFEWASNKNKSTTPKQTEDIRWDEVATIEQNCTLIFTIYTYCCTVCNRRKKAHEAKNGTMSCRDQCQDPLETSLCVSGGPALPQVHQLHAFTVGPRPRHPHLGGPKNNTYSYNERAARLHTHTATNTHRGCPVGGQLLQEWEGCPVNGFHRPATHGQIAGLTRVQHTVPHAHLASPPTVLRATGDTNTLCTQTSCADLCKYFGLGGPND